MSFMTEFEYTLADFKVCAKAIRRRNGAKFYIRIALCAVLISILAGYVYSGIDSVRRGLGEEVGAWVVYFGDTPVRLDGVITLLVPMALFFSSYTDRARGKRLLNCFGNRDVRISIDDDGVRICQITSERIIWYWGIKELYFSDDVWLLFWGDNIGGRAEYVIIVPCRGFTEGNPKELGGYLSRMCGKEVKKI